MRTFKRNLALLFLLVGLVACSDVDLNKKRKDAGSDRPVPGGQYHSQGHSQQFAVLDPNAKSLDAKFPIRTGDRSQIAVLDSSAYLSTRMALLDQAKSSVLIQYYIWKGDESGYAFVDKLIEVKNRGVNIHVIIDPLANLSFESQNLYARLVNNDIKVEGFQPFYQNVIAKAEGDLGDLFAVANFRYHEKMFIVDHDVPGQGYAVVGGTNIANEYFRLDNENPEMNWRDKDVVLRGEIVQDVAKIWQNNLQEFRTTEDTPSDFDTIGSFIQELLLRDPQLRFEVQSSINQAKQLPSNLHWQPAVLRFIQSRPRHSESYILQAYKDFISSAQQEVLIASSYFLPSVELQNLIKSAAARGVRVTILTNGKDSSDYPSLVTAARTLYKNLLEINRQLPAGAASIRLVEWGGHRRFNNGEGLHHAKYAVFDRKAAIVGSYNLDPRSKNFNSETIIAFENPQAVQPLIADFERDSSANYATPISYEEALNFKDPDGLLETLQTRFLETLIPLF